MMRVHKRLISIVMSMALLVGSIANYKPSKAADLKEEYTVSEKVDLYSIEPEEVIFELDEKNTDVQGIVYTLNLTALTASVGSGYNGYNNNRATIPEKVIKDGVAYKVTVIADEAFCNSCVQHIDIYADYLNIGASAFKNSKIEFIDLSNVTYVGDYAFSSCNSLESIYFREVMNVGNNCFEYCTNIKAVYMGTFNNNYNDDIFEYASIETLVYDDTTASFFKLDNCNNIKNAFLPNTITSISGYILKDCARIKKLFIPESVESIGNGFLKGLNTTLYGKKGSVAEKYALENGLKFEAIDNHEHNFVCTEFYSNEYMKITADYCEECSCAINKKCTLFNPKTYDIPSSPFEIDDNNKDYQGIYYELKEDKGTATVGKWGETVEYNGTNGGYAIIPDTVIKDGKEYIVNIINYQAFSGVKSVVGIIIGDNVTDIKFHGVYTDAIRYIHLGKNVKEIDDYMYFQARGLKCITVDDDNENFKIVNGVLFDKAEEELICYPNYIYNESMYYEVPEVVETINEHAFRGAKLKEIYLPKSVEYIEEHAFAYTLNLKTINLDDVKKIDCEAFIGSNIKSIMLNEYVVWYDESFESSELEALYVKGIVKKNPVYANSGSNEYIKLKSLIIDKDSIYDNFYFSDANGLEYVILPEDMVKIPQKFATDCIFNKPLYVPATVEIIGQDAFKNSTLTICGYAGTAIETYSKENGIEFIDITNHEHNLTDFIFYEDENFIITGKYCEECGYGTECDMKKVNEDEVPEPVVTEKPAEINISYSDFSVKELSKYNAVFSTKILNSENKHIESVGCYLYDESGELIKNYSEKCNIVSSSVTYTCDINNDMSYILTAGTKYKFQIYVTIDGKEYKDIVREFNTVGLPTPESTASSTPEPTASPIPEPTASPTPEPTASPTSEPTVSPTPEPTASPTPEPTIIPTPEPTVSPTPEPTASPTPEPTASPTPEPTASPTPEPTATPLPERLEKVGRIVLDEANVWERLLEVISFGIYKAPETKVIIESDLKESDIYYYIDGRGKEVVYTEEELESLEWLEYDEEIILRDGKNVVYAKIADAETGYVYYLCTDGVVVEQPTASPTPEPTASPTPEPTASPTPEPTASPTPTPTASPTPTPTASPTPEPTASPTPEPTASPTPTPTASPTPTPTASPTPEPTASPALEPTASPASVPTVSPTPEPTASPTPTPTASPTPEPTASPTPEPTTSPTPVPTASLMPEPTASPTPEATASPTPAPTASPTPEPTASPTPEATASPTPEPTASPTLEPTASPASVPTVSPTPMPTASPTPTPTASPTPTPTASPTPEPTSSPTPEPTSSPTPEPTPEPTSSPTPEPTPEPTASPMPELTASPTPTPTASPTPAPTASPTPEPTASPTLEPTTSPTPAPTANPMPEPTSSPMPATISFTDKLTISSNDNKTATLKWKGSDDITAQKIYRSTKKNGKYKCIAALDGNASSYVDKTIKPLKTYYYKIEAGINNGYQKQSIYSNIHKIKVTGLSTPAMNVKVEKGKNGVRYIVIKMKKCDGKYFEVYVKQKKKYQKIQLTSNLVKKHAASFKLRYTGKNKKLSFKIRTYNVKNKKKIYSNYSKQATVKIK